MRKIDGLSIMQTIFGHSNTSGRELADVVVRHLTQDSRSVQKESCFICISGAQFDGHSVVKEVAQAGAVLIIAEKPVETSAPVIYVEDTKKALAMLAAFFYEYPSEKLKIVGVTGTNGKTTVTHMIEKVVADFHRKTGIIGTMYNKIDAEILPTINTTPDALTLHSLLDKMVDADVAVCSMEVSSHALVQGRAWGVDFDVAVFTNLSQDHLEYHGTMEDYFAAKSLLFSQLGNSYSQEKQKLAVVNVDDDWGKRLLNLTAAPVLTYGCNGEGQIQADNILVTSQGTNFDLTAFGKTYQVSLKMIGKFNIYNAMAAFGACYALRIPPKVVIKSLADIEGVKGRFQLIPNNQGVTVIVDYAHTPDGLLNVLTTIEEFAKQDVYCVVGCGGDRDPSKRPVMAKVAIEHASKVIFTSDNPRTEDPVAILQEMVAGLDSSQYQMFVDRKEAIFKALEAAKAGDVVLIAGKGHEDYQIIGTTKHHFDDAEVVNEFYKQ